MDRRSELNFDDVRGARVTGRLPVPAGQVNAALSGVIRRRQGRITQVNVEIRENNCLAIGLKVAIGPFWKWLRPELKIERRGIWDGSPVVILELSSARYGALSSIIEIFAKELLPAGVRIAGRQIVIDLLSIPRMAAYRPYLEHLKDLQMTTEQGRLWIDFDLSVE
jgi:hypothetical protein